MLCLVLKLDGSASSGTGCGQSESPSNLGNNYIANRKRDVPELSPSLEVTQISGSEMH
jgi:hypothetical protein